MKETTAYHILQRAIYPVTMIIAVILFFQLFNLDDKHLYATSIPIFLSVFIILLAEKYLPYNVAWRPNKQDLKNDGIYFILIQTILPNVLVWLTALFIIRFIGENDLAILHVWPHQLPIWIQEIILVLVSDFLRYWLHRFNHNIPALWRLHAVHHSVNKMYWMNTARFHPVEKSLQFMMDVFPFMLLGVSEQLIALHLVLYGVNGFFQHSNINLKFGWLNYIISSTELHRWHHSRKTDESNNNYGNNVIVWDIVFGSYFKPENRQVAELGLLNRNYPFDFTGQMKAPLIDKYDKNDLPEISLWNILLNLLLKIKFRLIRATSYRDFLLGTKNCEKVQRELLVRLTQKNKNTLFGKEYAFSEIRSYQDYKKNVPVTNYEMLEPYIKMQAADQSCKALIEDEILMFNKTSGTTSAPKLIPVTQVTLKGLKRSQSLMLYVQSKTEPYAYHGKVVGIVGPALERMSEDNIPIGSASGHFYEKVIGIVRTKYVIPYEVLKITDYELKYYVILLFCLQYKDITYIATANPSTLLKLAEILKLRKNELLIDLRSGTVRGEDINSLPELTNALKKLKPSKKRLEELEMLFQSGSTISLKLVWPYIRLISTWTGGSCGIALSALLEKLPGNTRVIDLGLLASEIRCTVTMDVKTQSGLPTYQDNFFEFIERKTFEAGVNDFKLLHELTRDTEYYIFVTTPAGLYRYNMNDVIVVTGKINDCPLIKFVQKGKGVCNITGEKLYESQLLSAMQQLELNSNFIQVLANEVESRYELFIEPAENQILNIVQSAEALDLLIAEQNIEYKEKRASKRLHPIIIYKLQPGTFDVIKKIAIENGQSEGQYKTMLLQYKTQLNYDIMNYIQ